MAEFKVLIGCQNDITGRRFEPGDTVVTGDFSDEVLAVWVEQGVLEKLDADPAAPETAVSDARQE